MRPTANPFPFGLSVISDKKIESRVENNEDEALRQRLARLKDSVVTMQETPNPQMNTPTLATGAQRFIIPPVPPSESSQIDELLTMAEDDDRLNSLSNGTARGASIDDAALEKRFSRLKSELNGSPSPSSSSTVAASSVSSLERRLNLLNTSESPHSSTIFTSSVLSEEDEVYSLLEAACIAHTPVDPSDEEFVQLQKRLQQLNTPISATPKADSTSAKLDAIMKSRLPTQSQPYSGGSDRNEEYNSNSTTTRVDEVLAQIYDEVKLEDSVHQVRNSELAGQEVISSNPAAEKDEELIRSLTKKDSDSDSDSDCTSSDDDSGSDYE